MKSIKAIRQSWQKLFKLATAVCSKCGYDNPYMSPDPAYVCSQCKTRGKMWGDDGEPKAKTPTSAPAAHSTQPSPKAFSPWNLMDEIALAIGAKFDRHEYRKFIGRSLLQRPDLIGYNKSAKEFKHIVNLIEKYLGSPTHHSVHPTTGYEMYRWEAFGNLAKRDPGALFFHAAHDINGHIDVYCKFVEDDYPK